jgi:hypothetical protein
MTHQSPQALRTTLTGIFTAEAVGRDQAIKLDQLLRRVDVGRYNGRQVREAIAELVVIDRLPIAGSSAVGYYRCQNWHERRQQMGELVGRIRALATRVRTFADAAGAELDGQSELDFTLTPEEINATRRLANSLLAILEDDA